MYILSERKAVHWVVNIWIARSVSARVSMMLPSFFPSRDEMGVFNRVTGVFDSTIRLVVEPGEEITSEDHARGHQSGTESCGNCQYRKLGTIR